MRSFVRRASRALMLTALVLGCLLLAAPAVATASGSAPAPSGSNGVNHNDTPLPGNPQCTNTAGTSGTCSQPQPLSTADLTNAGANSTSPANPYASTRNGAASDNGNGNGAAVGKPCAGCVGRADNKNPPGQAPNGPIDQNNGYECDGNNGIGQTNPAHTGCQSPPSGVTVQPTTCAPNGSSSNRSCTSTEMCSSSQNGPTIGACNIPPEAQLASQESLTPGEQSTVLGEQLSANALAGPRSASPAASVLAEQLRQGATAGGLAFTGLGSIELVLSGLALAGLGVLALRTGRRVQPRSIEVPSTASNS